MKSARAPAQLRALLRPQAGSSWPESCEETGRRAHLLFLARLLGLLHDAGGVTLFVGPENRLQQEQRAAGARRCGGRVRMDGEFTKEQIDDAICMVAGRYGRMVQDGQLESYGSTE